MSDIPVNPDVLAWARETAGLSIDEVVSRINRKRVSSETVLAWEKGTDAPSYPQLERLAYEIYKRPLAIFFFPNPPEEETAKQSFRTLPEYEIDLLPSRIRVLARKAQSLQLNLYELHEGANPSDRKIANDLSYSPDVPADRMAADVRSYLSVDLDTQFGWQDSEHAFKFWRESLEECGISVFKDAFREDSQVLHIRLR